MENTLKIYFYLILLIRRACVIFTAYSRIGLQFNFESLMFNHFMKWNERTGIPKELALLERVKPKHFRPKLSCEYFGIFYYLAKERLYRIQKSQLKKNQPLISKNLTAKNTLSQNLKAVKIVYTQSFRTRLPFPEV